MTKKGIENVLPHKVGSTEEARKKGRAGGLKSAKARRKKKELKEKLNFVLDFHADRTKQDDQSLSEDIKNIIGESGLIAYELVNLVMDKNNGEATRLNAIKEILDRTEGKVVQKQETEHSGDFNINYLRDRLGKATDREKENE